MDVLVYLLIGFVLGEYFALLWVYRLLTHHSQADDPVRLIDYLLRRLRSGSIEEKTDKKDDEE